jgi:threonine aldolase
MPSGTMAQQIALRIWCEHKRTFTVAMHPMAHPEFAEHSGYRFLHGIRRMQFGAPEFVADRMLTVEDLRGLAQDPAVVLLELPYRPLGGQLPSWEDLLATKAWAADRGVALHLDGARVWSCRPFYGKQFHEIAALFDSVYVSFYKDLGGLCGAMLIGPSWLIDEARIWQVRYGGRLKTMAPFVVSARLGMERVLPQIDRWVERARLVASELARVDGVYLRPDPPAVNMFRVFLRGDAQALTEAHHRLAEETGTFVFRRLEAAPIPGFATTEVHCWENALSFDLAQLRPFVERLLCQKKPI